MSLIAATIMLVMIMDPVGNSLNFTIILKDVDSKRKPLIIVRESLIAVAIQLVFLFFGKFLMNALAIEQPALTIGGAVILFLISLRMIFPNKDGLFPDDCDGEPFIVPLATPMLAGPSALAIVLLIAASNPYQIGLYSIAVISACFVTMVTILVINYFSKFISKRVVTACQRLTGMIITTISIQMFLSALEEYVKRF